MGLWRVSKKSMLTWILKGKLDFYSGRSKIFTHGSPLQAEGRAKIKTKGMTAFPVLGITTAQVQDVWWE